MKFQRSKKQSNTQPGRRRPQPGREGAPQAFAYYSQRPQSARPADKPRRTMELKASSPSRKPSTGFWPFLTQRFGFVIVMISIVLASVNMVRLSSSAKVESLNAPASSYILHDQATYQAAVDQYLHDSVFNSNKLTANMPRISSEMMRNFPELTSVSIAVPLIGHRPVVYIHSSEPALLLTSASGQTYVVDENGKALTTAARVHNLAALQLPVVHDESGLELQTGKQVLSQATTAFIREVTAQFKAKQLSVDSWKLPAGTSELDAFPTGLPYFVKFNYQHDSAVQQAGTYFAVKQKLEQQGTTPGTYIDVRVDGRAYYK